MTKTNIKYFWLSWSLWRSFVYKEMPNAGGTDRIFTINPRLIWMRFRA